MADHCEEKRRLAAEFTLAAEAYARAAKAVKAAIHGDLTKALHDAHQAHGECGKTRRALQAHMLKHRC
jgi:hypothetical protein